jgi:hypothetical protein
MYVLENQNKQKEWQHATNLQKSNLKKISGLVFYNNFIVAG